MLLWNHKMYERVKCGTPYVLQVAGRSLQAEIIAFEEGERNPNFVL